MKIIWQQLFCLIDLKKVTADMQTHKNPTLRTGPAPFKKPTQFSSSPGGSCTTTAVGKEPVFTRDGKKWLIVRIYKYYNL